MKLYTLLKDRASINILKILQENETKKKGYTMKYAEMKDNLATPENPFTIPNLEKAGLISIEADGGHSTVLAITKKGKSFVNQFDRLIKAFDGELKQEKAYEIQYDLTIPEMAILSAVHELTKGGMAITVLDITKHLHPRATQKKKSAVAKNAKKLIDLNLIERIRKGNKYYLDITKSGERVVKKNGK